MEKTFYGVKLIVKTGVLIDEPADAYISDKFHKKLNRLYFVSIFEGSDSHIFENIFRRTLEALLTIDKHETGQTVAIEKFTGNLGFLNNYQVIRAILCGMYAFCQITDLARGPLCIHETATHQITLLISPEDLAATQELERTENFKDFKDMYAEKPSMQEIIRKEYLTAR